MHFAIVFFNDGVWYFLLAGPERIELPPHGSKPRILSIELKAELVLLGGNDPPSRHYQCIVMPLYYRSREIKKVLLCV